MEITYPWRLLLVDDDPFSLATTQALVASRGYVVDTASSAEEAIAQVKSQPFLYALVILDYRLGDSDGARTIEKILEINSDLYVLIHSSDTSREALKRTWRAGAVGFLEKSETPELILTTINNWCQKFEETHRTMTLSPLLSESSDAIASLNMVGRSRLMAEVAGKVKRYATKRDHVLILGETGTGKELVARALHGNEPERFFALHCSAYVGNAELMESDLFGYRKGAFPGAHQNRIGILEAANGGTLFLDEIDGLDRKGQQKLLRAIQAKIVRPLGSSREYRVCSRLIGAAKPELETLAMSGEFLPDLFERLNVLRIDVPPLRERPEDIEPLVAYFCKAYEKQTGERKTFLYRTVKYLESYPWPRNVRELENLVRRLCIDTPGEKIAPEHLDAKFFHRSKRSASALHEIKTQWDGMVRKQLEEVLASSRSQREAARRLDMPESSLRRLIRKLGVMGPPTEP